MFCPNCGKELKDGALFCPKCGVSINGKDVTENSNVNKQKNKSEKIIKNNKIPIAVFIVLPFVVIIAILFIILKALNSSSSDNNSTISMSEMDIPLPTTTQKYEEDFDETEDETSTQFNDDYKVSETTKSQANEKYSIVETTKTQITETTKAQVSGNNNVVVTTQTTVNVQNSTQNFDSPTSAPEGSDNLENVEPGQMQTTQVIDDGPQSGSAVTQQNKKTDDTDNDNDSSDTGSDAVNIIEFVEQTEELDGGVQIHIMEPVVGCVTDEDLADNINSVLPTAIYEIVSRFNSLMVMEEKPVLTIMLNNVIVNEGQKRVNFSFKGTLQYQDGETKNVSASIVYTKSDNSCKVTAQTS